jgi:glycosyltransferase involved in cell wall biosynthesis
MKVLHVGAGNLFGGIEVLLLTLAKHRKMVPDLEPEFGFCFEGKAAQQLREIGVPVHLFGGVRLSRPWTILRARKQLRRLLTERIYDAILLHECWVHTVFAPSVRRFSTKLILWSHDRHDGRSWVDWFTRKTPPDGVVFNSDYSHESMQGFLPGIPSKTIYCAVESPGRPETLESRPRTRERFQTPQDAVVLIQIGRWEDHKGHRHLVRGLSKLKDLPNWVCWQVGAPQRPSEEAYFQEVQALVQAEGLEDRFRFLGWQPNLGEVLDAADIYCQPNERPEPFGITFIESLYFNKPILGTDMGGPSEIITADCGRLVKPNDLDHLAGTLRELISNPELRNRLSAGGPERAKQLCDPNARMIEIRDFVDSISVSRREKVAV